MNWKSQYSVLYVFSNDSSSGILIKLEFPVGKCSHRMIVFPWASALSLQYPLPMVLGKGPAEINLRKSQHL